MTNANTPHNSVTDDALLDLAAQEALGTLAAEESATLTRNLAAANEPTQRQAHELRETVTRLAAASPYMEPPARLRGALLLATAPAIFKMSDYQRKAETSPRLLRYGMIAAICFLAASAWYNNSLQNHIKQQDQQLAGMQTRLQSAGMALSSLVSPETDQIILTRDDKPVGKAFVNRQTKQAIVFMPGAAAQNATAQLTIKEPSGERVAYSALVVMTDPAPGNTVKAGTPNVELHDMTVDGNRHTYRANVGGQ
ncbi:MAG: hypothetical protein WCI73_08240 [Phycisphaerae bacterium]